MLFSAHCTLQSATLQSLHFYGNKTGSKIYCTTGACGLLITSTATETEMETEMEMLTRHSRLQSPLNSATVDGSVYKKKTVHELQTAVTEKGALQMPLQSSDAREPL